MDVSPSQLGIVPEIEEFGCGQGGYIGQISVSP